MDAVVVEEEGERISHVFLVMDVSLGIAEGAADEHGGSVADVTTDDGLGELGFSQVNEHGIDGVAEINSGVDKGAIEIEDDQTGSRESHEMSLMEEGTAGSCLF